MYPARELDSLPVQQGVGLGVSRSFQRETQTRSRVTRV